jgi:Na+-translocating membrane potential-generating system (MpsC)
VARAALQPPLRRGVDKGKDCGGGQRRRLRHARQLYEAEQTLIERGNPGPVRSMREAFQTGMESAFSAVVERALNRRVIASMSQIHIDPDMSVEIFVLEPQSEDPIAA